MTTGGVVSSTKTLAYKGFTRLMVASDELGTKFPYVGRFVNYFDVISVQEEFP